MKSKHHSKNKNKNKSKQEIITNDNITSVPLMEINNISNNEINNDEVNDEIHESLNNDIQNEIISKFQTINRINGGMMMKIKIGIAGILPQFDQFPTSYYKLSTKSKKHRWVCLHWNRLLQPLQWCLAIYKDIPIWFHKELENLLLTNHTNSNNDSHNNYTSILKTSLYSLPNIDDAYKIIKISDIKDIILNKSDTNSFHIYLKNTKEVIKLTPISSFNLLSMKSTCWFDAINTCIDIQQKCILNEILNFSYITQIQQCKEYFDAILEEQCQYQENLYNQNGTYESNDIFNNNNDDIIRRKYSLSHYFNQEASVVLDRLVVVVVSFITIVIISYICIYTYYDLYVYLIICNILALIYIMICNMLVIYDIILNIFSYIVHFMKKWIRKDLQILI